MAISTHYAALRLTPTAPPEVIRAAYKALALIYHPDKTLHKTPQERASHAAVFNRVQAAYDVLGNKTLKASYDAELERHSNSVDAARSTFHHGATSATNPGPYQTPERRPTTVKLTTPEEKLATRARARHLFEYFQEQRAKRDADEAAMDSASLRSMLQIWKDLAEENKEDKPMHAQCSIRVFEYEQKIVERERQHDEWLAKMAKAKSTPLTSLAKSEPPPTPTVPRKPVATRPESLRQTPQVSIARTLRQDLRSLSPTPQPHSTARVERKRAEAERVAAAALRSQIRLAENARREAAKKARTAQRAADARAEKEKQKAKIEQLNQQEAERIAIARAKVRGVPLGSIGATSASNMQGNLSNAEADAQAAHPAVSVSIEETVDVAQGSAKNTCDGCGLSHKTFREWRMCDTQGTTKGEGENGSSSGYV
jgi:curved DNA-binding protein CbpA